MKAREAAAGSAEYADKTRFFQERSGRWLDSSFSAEELSRLEALLVPVGLKKRQIVLEPGCGGGRLTSWLVEQVGEAGHVIACDLSERLIEGAKRRVCAKNVRWVCGPVEALDLREETLDRIICFQSFPHFEDGSKILRLFFQWTRPGGKLLIFHLISRERVNEIHANMGGAVANDLLPSAKEMKDLLKAAGWREITVSDRTDAYVALAAKLASN